MKFHFKNLSTFCFLLILSGCVKELTIETNGYKPQGVIWAILNIDSTIQFTTSGNRGIEKGDVVNFTNLTMTLFDNGIEVDNLLNQTISNDSQAHVFNVKALRGHTYGLKITNQNLEISSQVQTASYLSQPDAIELTIGENAQLKYTITDDLNYVDAYQLNVESYYAGVLMDSLSNTVINNDFLFIQKYNKYDEPSLNYNLLSFNSQTLENLTFPVSDNTFSGKKKTFLFTLQNPVSDVVFIPKENNPNASVSDMLLCKTRYVVITCRKITPTYYNFYISESKNNAIFGTPYFSPTNVYSNISGGLGLMAGATSRMDTVWIKK